MNTPFPRLPSPPTVLVHVGSAAGILGRRGPRGERRRVVPVWQVRGIGAGGAARIGRDGEELLIVAIVRRWTGHEAHALRTALRFSVRGYAEYLGVAVRTVSKWEAGGGALSPRPDMQAVLDTALGRADPDACARFIELCHAPGPGRQRPAGTDDPSRPDGVRWPGASASMVDAAVAESVEMERGLAESDLGPGRLDELDELVVRLAAEYFTIPPAAFRLRVLRWRRYVAALLEGRATLRERRRLFAVAGWLTGLLAEASLALGADADAHCATALSLAREVGHDALAGWVRGTQAQVALYAGDPRDAVAFARAGQEAAPPGSAVRFRASSLEMRAAARIGDRAAADRALSQAERALDVRVEPQTGTLFSFDAPYLPYYAGTACVWLGQFDRAATWSRQAIALCDADPSNWPVARTSARVDYATALLAAHEPEGAVAVVVEALDIWERRPTQPARKRIMELVEALRPFPEPCVVEVLDRWHAMSIQDIPAGT